MTVNYVISDPWKMMTSSQAEAGYQEMKKFINGHVPTCRIANVIKVKSKTSAESFGWYVRDVFRLYSILLDSMTSCRQWSVYSAHNSRHTRGSAVTSLNHEGLDLDINAMYFDAVVGKVQFKWEDNTRDYQWKPWNWEIPILVDDYNDVHYFFDPVSKRAIVNGSHEGDDNTKSEIHLFGFDIDLPKDFNFFEMVK